MQLSGVRPSVRPSVCLSVPSFARRSRCYGLLLSVRRAGDIDRLLPGA